MGRQMHRKCMRNELLNLSTIVSTTAWRQRNYIGTYKRSICRSMHQHVHLSTLDMEGGHHPLLIHFAQEYHRRRRGQHGVPYFVIRRPSSYASKRNLVLLDRRQRALLPRTCGAGTRALHPLLTPPRHEVNPVGHDLALTPFLAVLPVPTAPLQASFNERGTPFIEILTGRFRLATKRDHIDKADVVPPFRRAVLPPTPRATRPNAWRVHGQTEGHYRCPTGCKAEFRIARQIAQQDDFVEIGHTPPFRIRAWKVFQSC